MQWVRQNTTKSDCRANILSPNTFTMARGQKLKSEKKVFVAQYQLHCTQTGQWLCQYLLGEALCVLQTVCEWLDEKVAAALAQHIMVPTFQPGLGQQGQPDFSHRVTAGILPEVKGTNCVWDIMRNVTKQQPQMKHLYIFIKFVHGYLLILDVNLSASFSRERAYSLSISPRRRR